MFEARMQDTRLFGEAIAMVAGVTEELGTFKITRDGTLAIKQARPWLE